MFPHHVERDVFRCTVAVVPSLGGPGPPLGAPIITAGPLDFVRTKVAHLIKAIILGEWWWWWGLFS